MGSVSDGAKSLAHPSVVFAFSVNADPVRLSRSSSFQERLHNQMPLDPARRRLQTHHARSRGVATEPPS